MSSHQHTRSTGRQFKYAISYAQGEYFISRDGKMLKSFPDAVLAGMAPAEATPALMLRMAIADIDALIGMEE